MSLSFVGKSGPAGHPRWYLGSAPQCYPRAPDAFLLAACAPPGHPHDQNLLTGTTSVSQAPGREEKDAESIRERGMLRIIVGWKSEIGRPAGPGAAENLFLACT